MLNPESSDEKTEGSAISEEKLRKEEEDEQKEQLPAFIKQAPPRKKRQEKGILWYCYILGSISNAHRNSTYVGMTNDIQRRLQQHNKEMKGGAKYTSSKGPWQFIAHISGFPDKTSAMQAEYALKNMSRFDQKFRGPVGRIRSLVECLLNYDYWTSNYK